MYGILSASRVVDVAYSPFFFMSELRSHAGYFPRLFTTGSYPNIHTYVYLNI